MIEAAGVSVKFTADAALSEAEIILIQLSKMRKNPARA